MNELLLIVMLYSIVKSTSALTQTFVGQMMYAFFAIIALFEMAMLASSEFMP